MSDNEAIVFQDEREVAVENQSMPEPGHDEVLVETKRSLISTGTELAGLVGDYRPGPFPWVPGYTNVGEVVAVGDDVDESWTGRRVASWSDHQRYVTPAVEDLRPIPDQVTDEEAAFFPLAQVAMHGVRRGEVTWGETAAVYGLGLVGQMTSRVAHLAGARTVVGVDLSERRLSFLPDDVAGIEGVNAGAGGARDLIEDAAGGRLADVAFEVTGNAEIIPQEFEALDEQGRFVVLSSPRDDTTFDFYGHCHRPGHTIVGAHQRTHPPVATPQNPWTHAEHADLCFAMLAESRLDVEPLITHREPVSEAPGLYEMLLEDRTQALGIILEW